MTKNCYAIAKYNIAINVLMNKVISGLVATHPLLGQLGHKTVSHAGPIRNVRGDKPLDQEMQTVRGVADISTTAIRNTDIDEHTTLLWNLYFTMQEMLSRGFFNNISEITTATGNVVDAQGKPLSYDYFLDMLEMIEISFDDKGVPQYPTFIMSPNVQEKIKNIIPTEEQKLREEEIIDRKREEFYAKKRIRKLHQ